MADKFLSTLAKLNFNPRLVGWQVFIENPDRETTVYKKYLE